MDGRTAPCFPVGTAFGLAAREESFPPPNMSGLEDVLGKVGEAPSDGTSLLLTTAQFPGVGTPAETVAMDSVARIRPGRAPHMKCKYLLGMGCAPWTRRWSISYAWPNRRIVRWCAPSHMNGSSSARRCVSCLRLTPSPAGGWRRPLRPEGMVQTSAVMRALSRMVKDAARAETPLLRACDARYGCLLKYNMPATKGPQSTSIAPQPSVKNDGPSAPPKKAAAEGKPANRAVDRSRPRGRSTRAPRKTRGGRKTRRSRSPRRHPPVSSAETSGDRQVRDGRVAAWLAGEDSRGSLRSPRHG